MRLAWWLGVGLPLSAQVFSTVSSAQVSGDKVELTVRLHDVYIGKSVTGAPFAVDLMAGASESDSRLVAHDFRDFQGRRRIEQVTKGAWSTEIYDPYAGIGYVLDETNRVAHRCVLHFHTTRSGTPPGGPVKTIREQLGTRIIEGLLCDGVRASTTWSADSRDFTDTTETWTSRELRMMILVNASSSRHGKSIMRVTNVQRTEPDPALFQPPGGFNIVDETDTFRMLVKRVDRVR